MQRSIDRVGERHQLQVMHMHLRFGVDQHARIQQPLGVEQHLDALHHAIGRRRPIRFRRRGDGAARAVLGLEAAAIAHRHKLAQSAIEKLVERSTAPALEKCRPSGSAGCPPARGRRARVLVAVFVEQRAHVDDEVGQPFDGRRHVLGQHRRALGPRRAARSE
jgi:hypothetical protein